MKRWPLAVLALIVLSVGGRYIYGMINPPDDKTLIKQALAEAIKASKEGRAGGVIDKLSDNFKINGEEPGTKQIVDVIRNSHPEVSVADNEPIITEDTAMITSDVSVKGSMIGGMSFNQNVKDVQLLFKKEPATEYLIFPTTKWHLSAARIPPGELQSFGMP